MSCAQHRMFLQVRVRLALMKYGYGPLSVAFMPDEDVLRAYIWVFTVESHRLGQCLTEFGMQAKIVAGSFTRLREALR